MEEDLTGLTVADLRFLDAMKTEDGLLVDTVCALLGSAAERFIEPSIDGADLF